MDELTHIPQFILKLAGFNLVFNTETIFMTWVVMLFLIIFGILATRKSSFIPNPIQVVSELLVNTFYDLTKDALGAERVKKFFPLIIN